MTLFSRFSGGASAVTFALISSVVLVAPACSDGGVESEGHAVYALSQIAPLVTRDVEQVRKGLPDGAKLLAKHLADDPGADPAELQRRIKSTRANVELLSVSKGTFFSFTTTDGVVLRSEADPDRLVEKNVLAKFPGLAKALSEGAGVVEATGEMDEMRGVRTGPDLTWVAAHSVPGKDGGAPRGLFVTGWSYRAYAFYLEEAARRALAEEAKKQEKTRTPLVYVYLARGGTVYGAPVSPEVNAEAIGKHDVAAKAKDGVYRGQIEITDRKFGLAAQRLPELGEDATLVTLVTVY